jgi:hypothetical protein
MSDTPHEANAPKNTASAMLPAQAPADVLWGVPRIKDLLFSAQVEADAALAEQPMAATVRGLEEELSEERIPWWCQASFALPAAAGSVLGEALARIRMRLRLAFELKVYTSVEAVYSQAPYRGIREGQTLFLFLPQAFLQTSDPRVLAFHLGQCIWNAMDNNAWFVSMLRRFPLNWDALQTLHLRERQAAYSAAIYGLLSCGDLATAVAESWRPFSPIQKPLEAPILMEMSAQAAASGDPDYWERQLQDCRNAQYPLLLPTVLRRFTETDTCHALLGATAGSNDDTAPVQWDSFDKQVRELDHATHQPSEEWESKLTTAHAMIQPLLATYILSAIPDYPVEKIREALDRAEMLPEAVADFFDADGWDPSPGGNNDEFLDRCLTRLNTNRRLAFCAADLLSPIGFTLIIEGHEYGNEKPEDPRHDAIPAMVRRFVDFAGSLGIGEAQARMFLNSIHERLEEASTPDGDDNNDASDA